MKRENVCIARRRHPRIRKRLTLEQYSTAGHVGILYCGEGPGLIDNLLAARGLRRRLALQTPHFLTAPFLVAGSDLIATVPKRPAQAFRARLPLAVFRLPLLLPTFALRMLWHERTHTDPAHQWLRSAVVEAALHHQATRTARNRRPAR